MRSVLVIVLVLGGVDGKSCIWGKGFLFPLCSICFCFFSVAQSNWLFFVFCLAKSKKRNILSFNIILLSKLYLKKIEIFCEYLENWEEKERERFFFFFLENKMVKKQMMAARNENNWLVSILWLYTFGFSFCVCVCLCGFRARFVGLWFCGVCQCQWCVCVCSLQTLKSTYFRSQ